MRDVCLNAGEKIQCHEPLSAYATLPDKPSWCDKQEPEDDPIPKWLRIIENVAIVIILIVHLFCCSYLCYKARRQIKECICGNKSDSGSSQTGEELRNESNVHVTAPTEQSRSKTEEGNEEEMESMLSSVPGISSERDNTASDSARAGEEKHSKSSLTLQVEGNQGESYA